MLLDSYLAQLGSHIIMTHNTWLWGNPDQWWNYACVQGLALWGSSPCYSPLPSAALQDDSVVCTITIIITFATLNTIKCCTIHWSCIVPWTIRELTARANNTSRETSTRRTLLLQFLSDCQVRMSPEECTILSYPTLGLPSSQLFLSMALYIYMCSQERRDPV